MSKIIFIILVSIFLTEQVKCASVNFTISLATPNLNLNCTYTLEKNEVLYQVILKRDTSSFVKFNENNKNNPEFIKIDGISNVTFGGVGVVTINNYVNSTWGTFSCIVLYDTKTTTKTKSKKSKTPALKGSQMVSKKYKLTFKAREKCMNPDWTPGTPGQIPPNAFKASQTTDLYICRATQDGSNNKIPGFVTNEGCTVTYTSAVHKGVTPYEILTGSGFQWKPFSGTNQNQPQYSYGVGNSGSLTLYAGSCLDNGKFTLGKIDDHFYYADTVNNEEKADCKSYQILICQG